MQNPDHSPTTLYLPDLLSGTASPVQWLVPEFLPQGTLVLLAGEPGTGKSFLAMTLGLAIAGHVPLLDYAPQQGAVLYCDQENSYPDTVQYLRWGWHGLGCPPLEPLAKAFHLAHFQLGHKHWATYLEQLLERHQPRLLVIDTATSSFNIQQENDNSEAARIVVTLRSLQSLVNPPPSIVILKHAKITKDGEGYTVRGAKDWLGTADGVLYLLRQRGRPRLDGLNNTRLVPDKVRAFGLRKPIAICPSYTPNHLGLALARTPE